MHQRNMPASRIVEKDVAFAKILGSMAKKPKCHRLNFGLHPAEHGFEWKSKEIYGNLSSPQTRIALAVHCCSY